MAKKRLSFKQDTIALVYDFDGTLSPQPMQEYKVLPKIDIPPHVGRHENAVIFRHLRVFSFSRLTHLCVESST